MEPVVFIELIEHAGLVLLMALGLVLLRVWARGRVARPFEGVVQGLLFGAGAVLLMLDPIAVTGGAMLDPRAGPAVLAGVLGGPVAGLVAAACGAFARYFVVGGPTALGGAASFFLYAGLGVLTWAWLRARGRSLRMEMLPVLAIASAAAALPSFFVGIPVAASWAILAAIWPVWLLGNVIGVVGTGAILLGAGHVLDLRDRLIAREAESRRLALVARHAAHPVVIAAADGTTEWVNEAFEQRTGYTMDEMAGRRPSLVLGGPLTDPETVAHMRERVLQGEGFKAEVQYYDRAGRPYWVDAACEAVREPGQPLRFVVVMAETTERKRLEQRLTRAESVGRMGHWSLDPVSGDIDWSYETFRIFGIDPAAGIPSLEGALARYHPEDSPRIAHIIETAVADGTGFSFRARLLADGTEKRVEVIGECERGEDGRARRFFGVIQDITASVQREEALGRALERAEAANRVKSEFLATMSHELRTPLNAIAGYSEIMAAEMFGPLGSARYVGYARDIHGSAQYLRELIEGVLELSSLEAERRALTVEALVARDAVEEALALVRPAATAAGVGLVNAVPEGLRLASDRRALKQIVINCLDNAVKFSPAGSEVTVAAELQGEAVALTVADRGCGIPPEHLQRVTEPFFRAHAGRDAGVASIGGTGIGLALVHRYMASMNGRLEISSVEGEGTTVVLTFPLSPAPVHLDRRASAGQG